jgi:menaquinone-specific isochorismate synthase
MTHQEAVAQLRHRLFLAARELNSLTHSDTPCLIRWEAPLPRLDLLAWLDVQPGLTKLYWSTRDSRCAVAAIGAADDRRLDHASELGSNFEAIQDILARGGGDGGAGYFGGVGFDDNVGSNWPGFHYGRFVLPQFEVVRRGDDFRLACNLLITAPERTAEVCARLHRLLDGMVFTNLDSDRFELEPRPVALREDGLSTAEWRQRVRHVLALEAADQLDKLVLSREVRLTLGEQVTPWRLLSAWRHQDHRCFGFAFQFESGRSFLGCSPERLFRLRGQALESESVAGTVCRGVGVDEDVLNEKLLKEDVKVIRENALVREHINSRLRPLCRSLSFDPKPSILKLNRVQHLRYRLRGELKESVSTAEVLAALHPTPAVGGSPQKPALDLIRELEPHRRGWYSGAVGHIGCRDTELAVAIRCALLDGNRVRLYSGAGIVLGSEPEAEWRELESKIAAALSLFA